MKQVIKLGHRATYGTPIEPCPKCHKRKIKPFCQCPEEPKSPVIKSFDIIVNANEGGKLKSPITIGYGKEEQKIFEIGIYVLGELRIWVIKKDKKK